MHVNADRHGCGRITTASVAAALAVTVWTINGSADQLLPRGQKPSTPEQEVLRASAAWFEAVTRGDADAVDQLETDDFLIVQQMRQGVTISEKPGQLENLRKTTDARRGFRRTLSRTKVRTYDNVAILTAVATYNGENAKAEKVTTQAFITEVWVNNGTDWRLSHVQSHTLPRRSPERPIK